MDVNSYKIVEFEKYCATCVHKDKKHTEMPCDECLENPVNLDSKKPVNYEEK